MAIVRRLVLSLSLSLGVSAVALGAAAEPDAAESARRALARSLADEGARLLEAGHPAEAEARFREALQSFDAPTLRLALARALEQQGRLVEAKLTLEQLLAAPQGPAPPAAFVEARRAAREELELLEPRIPRVVWQVDERLAGAPYTVSLDGRRLSAVELGGSLALDPGKHSVAIELHGEVDEQSIELTEGQRATILLKAPSSGDRPAAGRGEDDGTSLTPVFIAFGVGLAGLTVGTITGVLALDNQSELERRCPSRVCRPEDESLASAANTHAALSTTGFIIAGLGAAVGVTLLLIRSDAPEADGSTSSTWEVNLQPMGAALRVGF